AARLLAPSGNARNDSTMLDHRFSPSKGGGPMPKLAKHVKTPFCRVIPALGSMGLENHENNPFS
ncbi:MAG TPA: hypothetical protein VGY77_02835, partial [Gemmataceae bacterium]|nr:hypothetical protein [Gemmataceae bacterium]